MCFYCCLQVTWTVVTDNMRLNWCTCPNAHPLSPLYLLAHHSSGSNSCRWAGLRASWVTCSVFTSLQSLWLSSLHALLPSDLFTYWLAPLSHEKISGEKNHQRFIQHEAVLLYCIVWVETAHPTTNLGISPWSVLAPPLATLLFFFFSCGKLLMHSSSIMAVQRTPEIIKITPRFIDHL